MTLILSGTDGLSDVDGSAATPAIRGTDANTGIYFPGADRIGFAEGGAQCGEFDASGNFLMNSGYGSVAVAYGCRAWVNFNGTGTVAIRASGNVTSITDNGTGDYTVNFTTAMPDANYAAVCNTVVTSATNINFAMGPLVTGILPDTSLSSYTTSAVRVIGRDSGGTARDTTLATVAIFR